MDYILIIGAALVLPFVIGWLYGRNLVNPNTPKGRAYYISKD